MKRLTLPLTAALLGAALAACGGGGSSASTTTTATGTTAPASAASATGAVVPAATPTTTPTSTTFSLLSAAAVNGTLPAEYTCDGPASTPALSWSAGPTGTTEYALLMTTLPGDGSTKYNWVLYGIPATKTSLAKDSYGVGMLGVGSDGPNANYQAPCSQGLGEKAYTFTVYALSAAPTLSSSTAVSGAALAAAMAPVTVGTAALTLTYNRTATAGGLGVNCLAMASALKASTTGLASVGCDSTYGYISANGLATHTMMNGITASNLQFPLGQNFYGANAWKIPLNPAIAATTTTANDGPIGMAINGVPIFNPCKQGGCQNGDTKVLGELDVCNGHAGRADDYHYHAAPTCLMATKPATYWDTHPLGWALDGFGIFGYNNADGTVATRDTVCGGNTTAVSGAPAGYSYHVTDTTPYVLACFRGTPSPDLTGQGAKYSPIRQPPVTPFPVSAMTLTTDTSDGYQVVQFTSARSFITTETGTDSTTNAAGTYKIRYKSVTGAALTALLATAQNSNKSACWNFQFTNSSGSAQTQPTISYCR